MSVFTEQTIVNSLGWTLLHFIWQGALIAGVLAALLRASVRASANLRYGLGCAALLLLALTPVATFSFIQQHADSPAPTRSKVERDYGNLIIPSQVGSSLQIPRITQADSSIQLNWREWLSQLLPLLVALWAVGVLGFSLRLATAWMRVNILRRRFASPCAQPWPDKLAELSRRLGIHRPVRLLQSALVEVPAVIGWLRPVILLPASSLVGLSPAQLEAILAHELAHIRRHDYLVNLCQTVLETILFYHPAVWWISRQVRLEREHCCDDLAVEICGDRLNYARALATLEELRQPPAQLALAASGAPLLRRIQRLVTMPPANPARPAWPFAGIVILALLTLIAAGLRGGHARADNATTEPAQDKGSTSKYELVSGRQNQPVLPIDKFTHTNGSMVWTPGVMISSEPSDGPVHQLLEKTRLDKLAMRLVPLPEVIKQLNEEAVARDPAHRGIRFALSPDHAPAARSANLRQEPLLVNPELYLGFVTVSIPELKDVSFADTLDLIALHADFPIQYVIFKGSVVFMKANVETKTFHLTDTVFNDQLKRDPGAPQDGASEPILYRPEALQKMFSNHDINLITNSYGTTPETFIWNYRTGDLNVRATQLKLAKIGAALSQFASASWQSNKARFPTVRTNSEDSSLEVRTFHLTKDFLRTWINSSNHVSTVEEHQGTPMLSAGSSKNIWVAADGLKENLAAKARQFFSDIGVDLNTNNPADVGKGFVWSDGSGLLMVRATSQDLDRIETGLGTAQAVTTSDSSQSNHAPVHVVSSGGRERILSLMQQIHIDHIQFDHVPIGEVIEQISEICMNQGTNHVSINFLYDRPTHAQEQPADIQIDLTPGLTNVTLTDLLNAITQTATAQRIDPASGRAQRLRYRVLDYAIQFYWHNTYSDVKIETFKLNKPLKDIFSSAVAIRNDPSVANETDPQAQVGRFITSAGADMDTNNPANANKAFVYQPRPNIILMRASTHDLDCVQKALKAADAITDRDVKVWTNTTGDMMPLIIKARYQSKSGASSPSQIKPEVNLKVKIAVVDEEQTHKAGIDWLFTGDQLPHREIGPSIAAIQNFPSTTNSISSPRHPVTNSIISQFTGTLSESEWKGLSSRLENTFGVDVLTVPEITTEMAREAMVMEGEQNTIVTGVSVIKNGKNPSINYSSETISFGPIVDMVPKLNETNGSIDLLVTSSIGEFAGYAEPHDLVKGTAEFPGYEKPHPQFHLWQMRAERFVTNTETLVIVGLSAPETNVVKDNVPVLGGIPLLGRLFRSTTITKTKKDIVIFVIPTLINPDGTRWKEPAK